MENILRRRYITILLLFCWVGCPAQKHALKTNLLFWGSATPNVAYEVALSNKTTLDLKASYNPFEFGDNKKWKHWMVQPELRFWKCEKFNGFFWGIHLHGGEFNLANLKLPFGIFPALKDHRYEGYFYGGGLNLGYHWILSKHWGIEATLGGGYSRVHYEKYTCGKCTPLLKEKDKNYVGPTQAAISFIYLIK